MEASLIRFLPDSRLVLRYSAESTKSALSALPAQPPLSLRKSLWSASGVFEGCPLLPRAGPDVRRGHTLQVCHTGQLAWPCLRPWKLGPSPFRRVLLRSSRSPSSCLHLRFLGLPPISTRIRGTSR